MGPKPSFHNRRGYLSQTVFDAERGSFVERPIPFPSATARRASPGEAVTADPDSPSSCAANGGEGGPGALHLAPGELPRAALEDRGKDGEALPC